MLAEGKKASKLAGLLKMRIKRFATGEDNVFSAKVV